MGEIIQNVLITGDLDDARLCRAKGELADVCALPAEICRPTIVIDSNGGSVAALHNFLESISQDPRTRAALERAKVKIYNAQSAAAVIALTFGSKREMACGSVLGFHMPSISLLIGEVDRDNRVSPSVFEPSLKTAQMVERLVERYGLHDRKAELYCSGWLRVTAQECLSRGLVDRLYSTGPSESPNGKCGPEEAPGSQAIGTLLISGLLTEELLDRVLWELRDLVAESRTQDIVFLIDSPGGSSAAVVSFLEMVKQNKTLHSIVERANVKIYEAHSAAALLAFSLGSRRELYRNSKVGFHLGAARIQLGNPDHVDLEGRVSPEIMENWQKYQSMVVDVFKRLELIRDPRLNAELFAGGHAEAAPEQLLRCGAVSRLF